MKDTFQCTPELLCEFFDSLPRGSSVGDIFYYWDKFKSSKAPKKEWEIVEVANSSGCTLHISEFTDKDYPEKRVREGRMTIHSVRRLSDGTIWLINETLRNKCVITAFVISGNEMLIKTDKGTFQLHQIEKLPAPVLTTVDGVEVFKGEDYWGADVSIGPCCYKAGNESFTPCANMKLFSTKESALQYQRDNRPLLSLNDVKKILNNDFQVHSVWLLNELTALVKQKLNP